MKSVPGAKKVGDRCPRGQNHYYYLLKNQYYTLKKTYPPIFMCGSLSGFLFEQPTVKINEDNQGNLNMDWISDNKDFGYDNGIVVIFLRRILIF